MGNGEPQGHCCRLVTTLSVKRKLWSKDEEQIRLARLWYWNCLDSARPTVKGLPLDPKANADPEGRASRQSIRTWS